MTRALVVGHRSCPSRPTSGPRHRTRSSPVVRATRVAAGCSGHRVAPVRSRLGIRVYPNTEGPGPTELSHP